MPAYYFRVIEDDKPNGWIGFAYVRSKDELFHAIDEYVDPYAVQIKNSTFGSYCRKIDLETNESLHEQDEFAECEPCLESKGWRDPDWEVFQYYYRRKK
jgi:hypothetical protein